MRALAWHGKRDVRVDTVPDPGIELATHHLPLEQARHGYHIFQKKLDGAIKVVLRP